jgi:hypothetical protein
MVGAGFQEIMSNILCSREELDYAMAEGEQLVEVDNVMSLAYSVLRNRIIPSLLNVEAKLRPLAEAGKLVGAVTGNHEISCVNHYSYDLTLEICRRLGVPYLRQAAYVRFVVDQAGHKRNVLGYFHHGAMAPRMPGAAVNQLITEANKFSAQIVLTGHSHHRFAYESVRLGLNASGNPRIVDIPVVVGQCGTYSRTYTQGVDSWAESRMFNPTSIGSVAVAISIEGHDHNIRLRGIT